MLDVTLQLHSPQPACIPAAPSHFETDISGLRITTSADRGMESCEVQLSLHDGMGAIRPAWLIEPVFQFQEFAHFTVTTGTNRQLFSGRISSSLQFIGGATYGFIAQGYWDALNDSEYSGSSTALTTSGTIIQQVILQTTDGVAIDLNNWADPSVPHAPSEFDGTSGGQVVDSLLREGAADGTLYDLQFWPGRGTSITAQLKSRVTPVVPDYECDWIPDPQVVALTYDPHQRYSHVRVRYTPKGGTETFTAWQPLLSNNTFQETNGFRRTITLPAGQKTQAGAEQFRDTQQAILSMKQWGGTIRVNAQYPLYYQGTEEAVPLEEIVGGQWVHVRGLDTWLQIQRCVTDYMAETADLTLGVGLPQRSTYERLIETAAAVQTGRNPLSGAKAV